MFTEETLAEIVRGRLGLESPIVVLWAIPEALKDLSRKIAANPKKRSLLMTDAAQDYALGADGEINLAGVGALREYLEYGEIWYENPDGERYPYPLQPLRNAAFVNAPLGNNFYHWYLVGDTLCTRNLDRNLPDAIEGNLFFAVPRQAVIGDMDANPELQPLLIEKVIELVTGKRNDAAEDGEN